MPSILMANKRGKLHEASASGNHLQLPFRDPPEGIFNFLRRKKVNLPKIRQGGSSEPSFPSPFGRVPDDFDFS
jgi:hypothetical protein